MFSKNTLLDFNNYHASTKIITATRLAGGKVNGNELMDQVMPKLDTTTSFRYQAGWLLWFQIVRHDPWICTQPRTLMITHEQSRSHRTA